jgi:hypothetical protein
MHKAIRGPTACFRDEMEIPQVGEVAFYTACVKSRESLSIGNVNFQPVAD